jgi:hypothetical protein
MENSAIKTLEEKIKELKRDHALIRRANYHPDEIIELSKEIQQHEQAIEDLKNKSVPTSKIIDYCESNQDFYIDDGETENRFYNAALNDIKHWLRNQ